MGCSESKADTLELVIRCRERRDLIRAAADHRYALAAAHVSYFRSLKEIGDTLRKFVDEDLIAASTSSSSSFSSPSLILPPGSKKNKGKGDESPLHLHQEDDSDLHLSDSSSLEDDSDDCEHNHSGDDSHRAGKAAEGRNLDEDEVEQGSSYYSNGYGDGPVNNPYGNLYPYPPPYRSYVDPYMDQWNSQGGGTAPPLQPWYYPSSSNVYYMKKSSPATRTVVQEPPGNGYYVNYPSGYDGNYGYFYEVPSTGMRNDDSGGARQNAEKGASLPQPPSPKTSAWEFLNPFDGFDNSYPGYYSRGENAYGSNSNASSPASSEVREREGIPDLEEETETEVYKGILLENRSKTESKKSSGKRNAGRKSYADDLPPPTRSRSNQLRRKGEGNSTAVPLTKIEEGPRSVRRHRNESRSRSGPSRSSEESDKTFMTPQFETEISKPSSPSNYGEIGTDHSANAAQSSKVDGNSGFGFDMRGSVQFTNEESSDNAVSKSIDDASLKKRGVTFEVEEASNHDGDSSKHSTVTLLSPNGTRDLKGVVAEIRDEFETASSYGKEVAMLLEVGKLPYESSFLKTILFRLAYLISPLPSNDPQKRQSRTTKLATPSFENEKACTLSSTLDKLCAWEKKLYKEVKGEERLRMMYLKAQKKLKALDEQGAESIKLDAARSSVQRLLSKLDMSIKAIDAIARQIHKLRDEELQPQIAALIYGLIKMWKAMLKCHQKQFRAIMESKMRRLKAITNLEKDSSTRASTKLEKELRVWCKRFNDWISTQKLYAETLNGWLLQCLHYEPEQTPDGSVPYSPNKLGAPPIFVICNDWNQAMKAISEARVADAMNTFASSLRQLWEKQDEEGRQRLKAEYLKKDYEKLLNETGKRKGNQDVIGRLSMIASDTGGASLDDNKVDIPSIRQRLAEERIKHKETLKLVNDAASTSLHVGLVPIFKALESFTSEALEAHEHVRLQQQQDKQQSSLS